MTTNGNTGKIGINKPMSRTNGAIEAKIQRGYVRPNSTAVGTKTDSPNNKPTMKPRVNTALNKAPPINKATVLRPQSRTVLRGNIADGGLGKVGIKPTPHTNIAVGRPKTSMDGLVGGNFSRAGPLNRRAAVLPPRPGTSMAREVSVGPMANRPGTSLGRAANNTGGGLKISQTLQKRGSVHFLDSRTSQESPVKSVGTKNTTLTHVGDSGKNMPSIRKGNLSGDNSNADKLATQPDARIGGSLNKLRASSTMGSGKNEMLNANVSFSSSTRKLGNSGSLGRPYSVAAVHNIGSANIFTSRNPGNSLHGQDTPTTTNLATPITYSNKTSAVNSKAPMLLLPTYMMTDSKRPQSPTVITPKLAPIPDDPTESFSANNNSGDTITSPSDYLTGFKLENSRKLVDRMIEMLQEKLNSTNNICNTNENQTLFLPGRPLSRIHPERSQSRLFNTPAPVTSANLGTPTGGLLNLARSRSRMDVLSRSKSSLLTTNTHTSSTASPAADVDHELLNALRELKLLLD